MKKIIATVVFIVFAVVVAVQQTESSGKYAFTIPPRAARGVAFFIHPKGARDVAFFIHPKGARDVAFFIHPKGARDVAFFIHPKTSWNGAAGGSEATGNGDSAVA